jgi:protein-tyrosine phosphatase
MAGVTIASAGTGALVGYPMTPEARAMLEGMGLQDDPPHAAQQLRASLIREADLILGLTRDHRRRIVQMEPTATRRAFTLREFGYVAGHVTPDDFAQAAYQLAWRQAVDVDQAPLDPLRVAVEAVFTANGVIPLADPAELDVADPFGQPIEAYAEAAVRMVPAIEAIHDYLAESALRPVPAPERILAEA